MTLKEALDYEIRSSWIVPWISIGWIQEILAWYYVRKAKRKYSRYLLTNRI